MSKNIKNLVISELRQRIGDNRDFLVVNASKMDAFSVNRLRNSLRAEGIYMLGVKNALVRRTLTDMGMTALDPYLKGPSVLVWGSSDMVALSRQIAKTAAENDKLEIKGGALDGTSLNAAQVDALSKSPGREELIGKILTLIRSPGARLASQLLGPGGRIAGQIESRSEEPAAAG
ncbi:MAG: 50S ribosomal protein L10 [Planctomycetales bacterium]